MDYREIDRAHSSDIRLKNQPFPLFGRLVPACRDGVWTWCEQLYPASRQTEMCFPDEDYNYDVMAAEHIFLGAYSGDTCVGLAVLRQGMFRYLYLSDLKVNRDCRRQGIGRQLMDKAVELAVRQEYLGVYAICQDNNLAACRFYLQSGFEIGGFDNRVYQGTSQEGKADIYFYRDGAKCQP